jgi:hypothetical protein
LMESYGSPRPFEVSVALLTRTEIFKKAHNMHTTSGCKTS